MENPSSDMPGPRLNFNFAFNNINFSDRVLHIEIMADSSDSISDSEGWEDVVPTENVAEVKTLNICSSILAANSPFFFKLFNNGIGESNNKIVTLRINKHEDAALTQLLKFMHGNTLTATTISDLLSVLIIADKFEVVSCIRYCVDILHKMPMSLDSARSYLVLAPSALVSELVQPLIDAAKKWLVARVKDVNSKSREEAMTMPLLGIEVVLGSDSLLVDSKDDLFEFILKWARAHYPNIDERREILTKRLAQFIPFSYMSKSKLREALICPDFDREEVSKLVNEALFFKLEFPYGQLTHPSSKCQLIKVDQFELPQPRCIVYFDIKKEECENLYPSGYLQSPTFFLGERSFFLEGVCSKDERKERSFGLYLYMTPESNRCALDAEFAVMKKASKEFENECEDWNGIIEDDELWAGFGFSDMFDISWIDLMSKESEYFIDGILHLRAVLTIINDDDDDLDE